MKHQRQVSCRWVSTEVVLLSKVMLCHRLLFHSKYAHMHHRFVVAPACYNMVIIEYLQGKTETNAGGPNEDLNVIYGEFRPFVNSDNIDWVSGDYFTFVICTLRHSITLILWNLAGQAWESWAWSHSRFGYVMEDWDSNFVSVWHILLSIRMMKT